MFADVDLAAKALEGRAQLFDRATRHGGQAWSEEKINLFACEPVEKNGSLFLGPEGGVIIYHGIQRVIAPGNHSQLVVRSDEWDGESGAEVEEGLNGERNLLLVVEWDMLH